MTGQADGRRCALGRSTRLAIAIALLYGGPTAAMAQQPARDPVGAEELFRQGVAAKNRDDWQTACEKFQKSFDLDPAVSTQYKLASCREHEGKLATAWYGYQSALKMNRETRSEKRRRELDSSIRAALSELEPRVPRLRITVTPAATGLELMRDGDALTPASVLGEALPVDPGEHTIVARAPGFVQQELRIAVTEGRAVDANVTLIALANAPGGAGVPVQEPPSAAAAGAQTMNAPSAAPTQTQPSVPQRPENETVTFPRHDAPPPIMPAASSERSHAHWTQRETAYVVGAAGIVSLLAAGYFGLRTLDYVDDMKRYKHPNGTYDGDVRTPRDKAVTSQNIGLGVAAAGGVLAAVSIGLYTTAPRGDRQAPRAWLTSPAGTLGGIAVGGRW